jgi:hypothetical protein
MHQLYRSCIVCGAKKAKKRTRLNEYHRNTLFIKRGIYIPPGARCCSVHFDKDQLSYEAIHQIVPSKFELVSFNSDEIGQIITDFRALVQNQEAFDFDNNASLDDTAYYNITGLLKSMISHELHHSHFGVLILVKQNKSLHSVDFGGRYFMGILFKLLENSLIIHVQSILSY